jgi:AsmA protein
MKKALIVLVALAGLLVLAGIAVIFLVDVNAYKPRIETAVSDALGMEFRIQGKAGLRLLPPAGVSFSDIRLRNHGKDLASAETFRVGVKLLPLLSRRVEVTDLIVEKPVILLEKSAAGRLNTWTPPVVKKPAEKEPAGPGVPLSVANAVVRDGRLVYLDRKDDAKTEISGINLSVKDLSLPEDTGVPLVKGIRFSGTLGVKAITSRDLAVSDVAANVTAANGVYDVRPFTMKLFGGKGEGEIHADLSKEKPDLKVNYTVSNFRAEESLAAVSAKKYLSGPLTLSENLSFQGSGADEMKRTASGQVSLRGEGLTVQGMDIDAVLSKVEEARQMNLADVGAFLLAGPLGTAATKGYSFGGVYGAAAQKGETQVTKLVSDWTVRNGVAETKDVAFATRKTRIALKGRLDIVNERFLDVTVAVLDAKGCATLRQKISGPFRNPKVDKVSTLQSAAAPILGLFEQARKLTKLLEPSKCETFYTGSVPQPK